MAFTAYKTWVVGDPLTAAELNTYVRDNGNEGIVVKSTAAGDIVYATAANSLSRLGIGKYGQVLRINSSTDAPYWAPIDVGSTSKVVAATTVTALDITFNTTSFTAAPYVTTAIQLSGTLNDHLLSISSVTTTGFTANLWRTSSGTMTVSWIALGT